MKTATQIKERPILFSAEMVRAILDGRKTQTRRVVKPQPDGPIDWSEPDGLWIPAGEVFIEDPALTFDDYCFRCPYGQPGDQLVFLCTWAAPREYDKVKPSRLPRDVRIWTLFDGTPKPDWCGKSRPGRFMPKWMRSRMPKSELISVRVERVQDISIDDCISEGAPIYEDSIPRERHDVRTWYEELWESINGPGSWEANPWAWVVEFKLLEQKLGGAA